MMSNEKPYVIPELKLVGNADDVVLASMSIGFDYLGEHLPPGKEFEMDDLQTNSR
jgi:hypothetical protein